MRYTKEELLAMVDDDGDLWLPNSDVDGLPEGFKFDKNINLSGTQITALPEGLTVGGRLDLSGTQITALPEGLTVGGWLDLSGTQITALPEGLTVGGSLYLSDTQIKNRNAYKKLRTGDYVAGKYLYADDILFHVKRKRKIGQYTYYAGKIKNKNVIFDGKNYAHCRSFKEGVTDLTFKAAKDRGANQYKGLSFDSVVSKEEAIVMYRIITGACQAGTQHFLDGLRETKDTYTIREIIDITRGQYGSSTFEKFFEED